MDDKETEVKLDALIEDLEDLAGLDHIDTVEEKTDIGKTETEQNDGEKTEKKVKKTSRTKNDAKKEKKGDIVPAEQLLPHKLSIVPLQGRPIFPGIFTPLMITTPEDTKVVEQAYNSDGYIGIVMLKNDADLPDVKDLCQIGTAAKIIKKINLPDGGVNVFISTIKRFKIRKTIHASSPICVAVEYLEDEEDDTFEVKALTRALISEMKEVSENNPLFSEEMRLNMVNIDHPGKIADFIASILNVEKDEQQKVLEILNVRQRMEQVPVPF